MAHTRTDPAHPAPGTPPALEDWTAGRAEGPPAFEGTVRVEALIAEDGSVVEAEVVSPGDLAEGVRKAAIRAVAAAIFDPPASEDTSPSWVSIEIPGRALPPLAEPAEQIPQP